MLKFRKITIGDKPLFEKYITNKERGVLSSFAYWYAWADNDKFLICETDDAIFIEMHYSEQPRYFAPYAKNGDMRDAVKMLRKHMADTGAEEKLFGISEYSKTLIEEQISVEAEFTEERNLFEYVYSAEALRTLAGKKYHSKRNHIANCLRTNNIQYFEYTDDMFYECMELVEAWGVEYAKDEMIETERRCIEKILKNRELFGAKAAVIRIDGKIRAFTSGVAIANNSVDIQFEKCHPQYRALYPVINQMFLQNVWRNAEFVNREEDMGEEGLRKAKLSYHPIRFEKRYTVVFK